MNGNKDTIVVIDDDKVNADDIIYAINHSSYHNLDVRAILPDNSDNFNDIIYQILINPPVGILVDINLVKFEYDKYYLGAETIGDGIDVANYLHKFQRKIPLAVYSADIDRFKARIDTNLDPGIMIFAKSEQSYTNILDSFFEQVTYYSKWKRRQEKFDIFKFDILKLSSKLNYLKKTLSHISPEKYFEVMGDYEYYLECSGRVRIHGNKIQITELQKKLALKYGLTQERIDEVQIDTDFYNMLKRMSYEYRALPILYWNTRSVNILQLVLTKFGRALEEDRRLMFNLQCAKALAYYYANGNITREKTAELSENYLDVIGRFEFQKNLLLAYSGKKLTEAEIINCCSPFCIEGDLCIFAIYIGEFVTREIETDTAWVTVTNHFDPEDSFSEPMDLNKLISKNIEHEGSDFYFILYRDPLGEYNSYIEPIFIVH